MRAFGKVPNLKGLISEFRAPGSGFRVLDDFELHHEMPYYQDLHCSPYCKSVVCSSGVYIACGNLGVRLRVILDAETGCRQRSPASRGSEHSTWMVGGLSK